MFLGKLEYYDQFNQNFCKAAIEARRMSLRPSIQSTDRKSKERI